MNAIFGSFWRRWLCIVAATPIPPTISAIKLTIAPGAHETVHTHPFDIIVIQVTPGEVDFVLNGDKSTGHVEPIT